MLSNKNPKSTKKNENFDDDEKMRKIKETEQNLL